MEDWNALLAKYGEWESYDAMIAVYTENFQSAGGNIYFMPRRRMAERAADPGS